MYRSPFLVLVLALGLVPPPAAQAATPIDQTRPLDSRGRVEIDNLKGLIEVTAWERDEVKVTGTLGDGVEQLEISGNRDNLRIKARYPEGMLKGVGGKTGPTTLRVQVPLRAALDIESVAADIRVDGVASSDLEIDSVSGHIFVAAAPGEASIDSVSGNQQLTLNSSGEISVESVSGDITLRGRLKGEVEAETVSGKIRIDSTGEAVRRLSANSVSGDISARVGLAPQGEIHGETVSGDFELQLPKALSARLSAESFSGSLAAPGAQARKEGFGPGSTLETRYGNGSGQIQVETFSGDMRLTLE